MQLPYSAALLQQYFSASEQYFLLTEFQHKHQHKPNFSEMNMAQSPQSQSRLKLQRIRPSHELAFCKQILPGQCYGTFMIKGQHVRLRSNVLQGCQYMYVAELVKAGSDGGLQSTERAFARLRLPQPQPRGAQSRTSLSPWGATACSGGRIVS